MSDTESNSNRGDDSPHGWQGWMGRIKASLGWATADRRVEAEGKLDELAAADPGPAPDASEAEEEDLVDEANLHVRNDHGDLAPSAEPDDQPVEAQPKEGG